MPILMMITKKITKLNVKYIFKLLLDIGITSWLIEMAFTAKLMWAVIDVELGSVELFTVGLLLFDVFDGLLIECDVDC